ncbi:MAG: DUF3800 domain-containing protein [Fibrobacteres bacterium]|nr:DUF3800 domain-containing protein [Fibrobacterota bacterium]
MNAPVCQADPTEYAIYCDESCHLEHDGIQAMALGAIWVEQAQVKQLHVEFRSILARHGVPETMEIKWTKLSPRMAKLYLELVDWFFDSPHLHFRGLVVPDKSKLRHDAFGQDHDKWYYKMFFYLLRAVLTRENRFRVYLDYKDTVGARKVEELHKILSNDKYDFEKSIVRSIHLARSHQVGLLQMVDVLIGALTYNARGLTSSKAKQAVVQRIRERSGLTLAKTTLPSEKKFNLFFWFGRDA